MKMCHAVRDDAESFFHRPSFGTHTECNSLKLPYISFRGCVIFQSNTIQYSGKFCVSTHTRQKISATFIKKRLSEQHGV